MMQSLLKGDRYSVSPCMDKCPPIDTPKPFNSVEAHAEPEEPTEPEQ